MVFKNDNQNHELQWQKNVKYTNTIIYSNQSSNITTAVIINTETDIDNNTNTTKINSTLFYVVSVNFLFNTQFVCFVLIT